MKIEWSINQKAAGSRQTTNGRHAVTYRMAAGTPPFLKKTEQHVLNYSSTFNPFMVILLQK